jgi:acetyltransferase-like isoleucine patch superfamily enzyme
MTVKNRFKKIVMKVHNLSIRRDPSRKNFYTKYVLKDQNLKIGEYTYGKPKVLYSSSSNKLVIGKYCSIAPEVVIFLGGNHRTDWVTTYPFPALPYEWPIADNIKGHPSSKGSVIIGNDVYIGYGAMILSGVQIGDGSVIAARAVVTKNVAPYSVVAGNPAKLKKNRFNPEQIKNLLEIKWWNWSKDKIQDNVQILCSPNIDNFIAKSS